MSNLLLESSSGKPTLKSILSTLHLAILWLSSAAVGWLLAAFALPWFGWLGVGGLVAYLGQVGHAGITLANVVLIVLMSLVTLRKAWPTSLGAALPAQNARLWATLLLVIWIGATVWLCLLGYGRSPAYEVLHRLGLPARFASALLTTLVLSAGLAGWCLYIYWFKH